MTSSARLRRQSILLGSLLAALLVGCAGSAQPTQAPSTPSPTLIPSTPVPSASPPPAATHGPVSVGTSAQAAALVFASDPRWSQMVPTRPDLIGASSWFESFEDVSGEGYTVNITVGRGDCEAGCIERHTWSYHVSADGTVELVDETGDPIEVPPANGGEGTARVTITLLAGPTCPVEPMPPNDCAPRAVAGADATIFSADGNEVATATSDSEGNLVVDLPAGAYYVVASPADGIMAPPEDQAFAVLGGDQISLLMEYDSGIR